MGFAILFLVILFGRTFYVQVLAASDLRARGEEQHNRIIPIDAPRGIIYDRNGNRLAVSQTMATVYANPQQIENADAAARALAPLLGVPAGELLAKLTKDTGFVYLARKIDLATGDKVKALDLPGVLVCAEDKRVYPSHALAPQVLGYVGTDNKGLAGLEFQYDEVLSGQPGELQVVSDRVGNRLSTTALREAVPGGSITLTIDQDIQFEVEKVLTRVVEQFEAKKASAVVLDPATGEVLAMANTPVFDTNLYPSIPEDDRRSSVIADQYEPGSTFKMVAAAGALEAGLVTPSTVFSLGPTIQVYDRVVHEAHDDVPAKRELSVTDILAQSSNVGAVKLGLELGKSALVDTIERFGFTQKLGIDFPGEAKGIMLPRNKWSGTTIANVPIGQGIAVSPLQLAASYAAIANDGVLVQPHLTRDMAEPWSRRVVSERVASQLRTMLVVTVEDGTGTNAQVNGYEVAGKTGTAQKVDEVKGGYADDRFIASFVGMVPADDPALVILVMVDEPATAHLGSQVAAPAFADIASLSLRILGVAPTVISER